MICGWRVWAATHAAHDASSPSATFRPHRAVADYGKLPLSFEHNEGQTDHHVKYLSRGNGYELFLTDDGATLTLQEPAKAKDRSSRTAAPEFHTLRVSVVGAGHPSSISGEDQLPGRVNYFIGKDPKNWHAGVPIYSQVKYRGIYPGVDLAYHGSNQRQLEYDFEVARGADPSRIRLRFDGAKSLSTDGHGDLIVATDGGDLVEHAPVIYQEVNGTRRAIKGGYIVKNRRTVAFQVASYDRHRQLVIDPTLVYSTFLGGSGFDQANAIAVDSSGNAYIGGYTRSGNFPVTGGAFQTSQAGGQNAFVTKLNPTGTALVYSTYLGGSDSDADIGITVDSAGDAYLCGISQSSDFPTTPGAFQTTVPGGNPAFVTKLDATGSALIYSTYLGGSGAASYANSIAVDSSGNTYVTGFATSSDFPTSPGAFQTGCVDTNDAWVAKLNSSGSGLIYSTYLCGGGVGSFSAIALDAAGDAYVTGGADANFPTTPGAFQTSFSGSSTNVFVTKVNPNGSGLIYSTLIGGSNRDLAYAIALNGSGNAYVGGITYSSDYPTTPGAFQTTSTESQGPFVTELNASGSALVYSTYLLASGVGDSVTGIAVDGAGDTFVTGNQHTNNFPVTANAIQPTYNPDSNPNATNGFITEIAPGGSSLLFSTYLGGTGESENFAGLALDSSDNVYVVGSTLGSPDDFPTTPGAYQTTYGGGGDAFVAKIAVGPPCTVTYNGTYRGNLNITSGLVCIINGTVTGNVTENGGGLITSDATIEGNLQITGGGTFSITSTGIDGNLQIQNIPVGSAQNQICDTNVRGNLQFQNNGIVVQIGSASASCAGNEIGGNLQVGNNSASMQVLDNDVAGNLQITNHTASVEVSGNTVNGNLQVTNNTASVQVFDDSAGGNLQCQSNSTITGSGDTAKSLQGQCASF